MYEIKINSTKEREVIDITNLVNDLIQKAGARSGVCNIFISHTTAALATADMDPETENDYLNAFEEMVPKLVFHHEHDPSHMPDHILSTLIGTNISIPHDNGGLLLGQWQKIILFEFNGPRERKVFINIL